MALRVTCPCGEMMYGLTDDAVVSSTQAHLDTVHQRSYSRDEIMFMAVKIPDRLLPPGFMTT
ncbi:DUF1059 domain-containing protein [Williamsia sp. R60]